MTQAFLQYFSMVAACLLVSFWHEHKMYDGCACEFS